MKVDEFIRRNCVGSTCPNFNWEFGCGAYGGEECDAAFCQPTWRGKTMRDRIDEFCEKRGKNTYGK